MTGSAPPRSGAAAALHMKLELAGPALRAATAALWRPSDLRTRYVAYLHAMHAVIRASVPLLDRAAARCRELGPSDALAQPLRDYLLRHIEEERGHDRWLLDDIAAAGGDPAKALGTLPPPLVARLVGAQYYWVEHHHPVTLLGYIAVLEGNAPHARLGARLALATGLPDAAFRTVRAHADLDAHHTADLDRLLDALALTPAQSAAVAVSALHTADALVRLFTDLATPARTVPEGSR